MKVTQTADDTFVVTMDGAELSRLINLSYRKEAGTEHPPGITVEHCIRANMTYGKRIFDSIVDALSPTHPVVHRAIRMDIPKFGTGWNQPSVDDILARDRAGGEAPPEDEPVTLNMEALHRRGRKP